MTIGELFQFIQEIGVMPKKIRLGVSKWTDVMTELQLLTRFSVSRLSPDVLGIREFSLYGVPTDLDTRLDPAAFEFDMEAT